jgi:hypothetical protein
MPAAVAIGKFVKAGSSVGVVVGLPGISGTPEHHYAVWYGGISTTAPGAPLARTVPIDRCIVLDSFEVYHEFERERSSGLMCRIG